MPRTTSAWALECRGSPAELEECECAGRVAGLQQSERCVRHWVAHVVSTDEDAGDRGVRLETHGLVLDGANGKTGGLGSGGDISERVRVAALPAQCPIAVSRHRAVEMWQ